MRWRARPSVVFCGLLAGGLLAVPAPAAAADERLFVVQDTRIDESSGLVDLGSLVVTTNDSGDDARLFVINPADGRTVGVVDYGVDVADVEALAPAGRRAVWVGDIGDNDRDRRTVSVYKVPVAQGRTEVRPARYRLAYPRGAHNAESLFADRQGRLHVITKSILGGTVYRAPLPLSRIRPNRLVRIGKVAEYATDAAALPGGRHVVVRGPERASVYTLPQLQRLGSFPLPRQRQGEGISVGPGSRILLSSEGVRSAVRRVALPAPVVARMRPPAATPASPSASPSGAPSSSPSASASARPSAPASPPATEPGPDDGQEAESVESERRWLTWSIPGVIALGAVGIGLGLRRRS